MHSQIARLAGLRVLVVGDVTLDEYLFGRPTRLSREAPVPVLELARREIILGGAANPARNIVALGSSAVQVGIVGADPEGEQLRAAFVQHHISPAGLITVAGRPTTVKTRILAHEGPRLPQQVARLDRLERAALPPADEQHILDVLQEYIPQVDAVLCSDYRIGLLSLTVVDAVRALCQQHRRLLTVDAQGNADYYHGVDLFRCNDREAAATLGVPLRTEEEFRHGVAALRQRLAAQLVIVTRGPEGVSLEGAQIGYTHLPASRISEVYDTTGAGDTFIAVATLALAAQLGPYHAARLANTAAALVVQRLGNAVVLPEELSQALDKTGGETSQARPEQ
jgi:rfaE bifunctional protein kinase chain/domain